MALKGEENIERSTWMPLRIFLWISCKHLPVKGMDKVADKVITTPINSSNAI